MGIGFTTSTRSTVGVEWELACVDRLTRGLAPAGPAVLAALADDESVFPHSTSELLTNTVELVSAAHPRVDGVVGDLGGLLRRALEAADEVGVDLLSVGTHPFSRAEDQAITPGKERYATLIDRMRWWGSQLAIWGVHVHVGVGGPERAIAVTAGMLDFYPHLQALSASSPFFSGVDTGYASSRAMVYQQASTAGLPPVLGGWADYERVVEDSVRVGIVADLTELRWDVRPSPRWGTVEVRVCDAPATLDEVGALTALTQCLAELVQLRHDEGRVPDPLPPWFARENKWRSARYGLECDAIVSAGGGERPVRDHLAELLEELEPIAARLGCADELRRVDDIRRDGAGYERQRRVAQKSAGDLTAVAGALVDELRSSSRPAS